MKEYKRLTKCGENDWGLLQNNSAQGVVKAIERLAELEDKIENGTLVELPCKVGDTIYDIDYDTSACYDCEHYSSFFGMDEMCDKRYAIYPKIEKLKSICDKHFLKINEVNFTLRWFDYYGENFNKTWFLTKTEAEAKLKELES